MKKKLVLLITRPSVFGQCVSHLPSRSHSRVASVRSPSIASTSTVAIATAIAIWR